MNILTWLDGKKTVIGAISSTVIGFLQAKAYIDSDLSFMLLSISSIIVGLGVTHKIKKKQL